MVTRAVIRRRQLRVHTCAQGIERLRLVTFSNIAEVEGHANDGLRFGYWFTVRLSVRFEV